MVESQLLFFLRGGLGVSVWGVSKVGTLNETDGEPVDETERLVRLAGGRKSSSDELLDMNFT